MEEKHTYPFEVLGESGVISLRGRISSAVMNPLMDAYHRASAEVTIALDVSDMEHIDVLGINALIKLCARAKAHHRKLVARGVSPYFRDIFSATRIDELIPIETARDTGGPVSPGTDGPWAKPVSSLWVCGERGGGINLNVDGLQVVGPVQGFGQLWEKTYSVRLTGISITPAEVIAVLKEHFPGFQPEQNSFYPSAAGIVPGEIVLINASTPAGLIGTGVWVLYADEESFTFMTPQGHPESGWVSFLAFEEQGCTVARVIGFARANDPLYELGFRLVGSREQEKIWTHVLSSLARHLGSDAWVDMHKTCVAGDLQWSRAGNIWYNAQIRTMLHSLRNVVSR